MGQGVGWVLFPLEVTMLRVLALLLGPALVWACSQAEPPPAEPEIIRIVTEVEVPVEVPVEVIKEVPVEVIVEVPVAPPDCPPVSDVAWLIESLEGGRATHVQWSEYLADNPPEEGSSLQMAVKDSARQLSLVAMYDRRIGVAQQLQKACAQGP